MTTPFGATGRFPEGKLDESDEGELTLGVAADRQHRVVRVEFGKPVAWLALPPQQAIELAAAIAAMARQVEHGPE